MVDMNEQSGPPPNGQAGTTEPPNPQAGPQSGTQSGLQGGLQGGPRVSGEQMRDVDPLRRSTTDRYIAGVAGGLGRHFDIDPTVIRVVLAVLTFFGGAGALIYGAVWLFVPEDGHDRAPIEVGSDARRVILIVAGAIALMIVFGTPFFGGGWGHGFPISALVIGLIAVALFATRGQRRQPYDRNQPPPPWGSVPDSAASASPEGTTMTATHVEAGQQPPAWMPPPSPSYVPPPRPRRTGLVLFWPTLAMIAIALGTLGIFDTSNSVTVSAYAALALGITGAMLLIGAFVGRPGGLIALGLASGIALLVTSLVGAATGGAGVSNKDLRDVPTSAALLQPDYHVTTGTIEVDLTRVTDPAALNGRHVHLSLNAGEVTVIVPRGINVHVNAEIRFAGQIDVGDDQRGGFGQTVDRTLTGSTAPGTPTLDLAIDARVGHIAVRQQ
jgi:phage shock protein PspC (stress-responsive transcriptional regulator)